MRVFRASNRRRKQAGGILLEFALVFGVLFAVVISIWTIGIVLIRYSILADTASSVIRTVSVTPFRYYAPGGPSSTSPTMFLENATSAFAEHLRTAVGADESAKASVRIEGKVIRNPAGTCKFQVSMAWGVPCFLCQWFMIPDNIMVTAEAVIENAEFSTCDSLGCIGWFGSPTSTTSYTCNSAEECWT